MLSSSSSAPSSLVARSVSRSNRQRQALEQRRVADLEAVRKVADEDVTRFGEELQRLDTDLLTDTLDEPTRQDYQRALDSYESAKESLARVTRSEDVRHVTEALEDGRYAVACVRARVARRAAADTPAAVLLQPGARPVDHRHRVGAARRPAAPGPGLRRRRRPGLPGRRARHPHRAAGRRPGALLAGRARRTRPGRRGYFGGYAASGLLPASCC